MLAIVDTGPLFASVDRSDADHERCLEVLERPDLTLLIPALVVAETAYLIGTRIGAKTEARFLLSLKSFDVEGPQPEDFVRMAHLVERYGDFPLGATDAFIVALAERLGTELVVTLDRRHFGAVRPRHCKRLTLLPEEH